MQVNVVNALHVTETPIVTFSLNLGTAKLINLFVGEVDALYLPSTQGSPIIR